MRNEPALEMYSIYKYFAMDVITSSAFGISTECLNKHDNEVLHMAAQALDMSTARNMAESLGFHFLFAVPDLPSVLSVYSRESMDYFWKMTRDLMVKRQGTGLKRGDFVDKLNDLMEHLKA